MKWFKHDSDATTDAKIRKLILKHGPVGYAVYFHCLELIAGNLSEQNVTFELEHDSEIIADNLKVQGTNDKSAVDIVQDIMLTIISLNLFSEDNGRVFCFKMLKRLDSSMTSSAKMRKLIACAKQEDGQKVMIESCDSHDGVMTKSCKTRLEQTRKEVNPSSPSGDCPPKNEYSESFLEFWEVYPRKKNKPDAFKAWKSKKCHKISDEIMDALKKQAKSSEWKKDGGRFIPYPASWLRGRRWEDEEDDFGEERNAFDGTRLEGCI